MTKKQFKMESPIGSLYLVASAKGLQGIFWNQQKVPFALDLHEPEPEVKNLEKTVNELKEYFTGKRHSFSIPLDAPGTKFQQKVWQELCRIPYGKTVSYKDIAKKIGNEKGSRAVGTANGKNPICIIVPCHRVITSNGGLGGYSGGLEIKKQLLDLEQNR